MTLKATALAFCALSLSIAGCTQHDATADKNVQKLMNIHVSGVELSPVSVNEMPIRGPLYEIRLKSGETIYSDAEGHYLVTGNVYDNTGAKLVNVTEEQLKKDRLLSLSQFSDADEITFPATGTQKSLIYVFTDVGCPYCHMLHKDVATLNQAGVTVKYIPFPREGMNSDSANVLSQVICSPDRSKAMSAAFGQSTVEQQPSVATENCTAAVEKGFQLGEKLGVQGTPAIVLPTGEIGAGYVPAEQIIQVLQENTAHE